MAKSIDRRFSATSDALEPIQKENEAPLSRGKMGGEWGESIPSSSDSGGWESIVSLPSTVWGRAPTENSFIVI